MYLSYNSGKNVLSTLVFLLCCILFVTTASGQKEFPEFYQGDSLITLAEKAIENNNPGEAIRYYSSVMMVDPLYKEARYQKLFNLINLEKDDEVMTEMDSLYQNKMMENDHDLLIMYGIILRVKENYTKAEEVYKKAEILVPNSSILHYNMGMLYTSLENFQKSIDHYKKAVSHNPNHTSSYFLMGEVLLNHGKLAEGALVLLTGLVNTNTGERAKRAIQLLNVKMSGYDKKTDIIISESGDDFSELNLILQNQLPLNAKYKLKSDIDEVVTRHIQAVLEYAATHKTGNGFFENMCIPWMKEVAKMNATEPLTYYLLQEFRDQLGRKITSKDKMVAEFVQNYFGGTFWQFYGKRKMLHFGKEEEVIVYLKDGWPSEIGKVVNNQYQGRFLGVNKHGIKISELQYDQGKLSGTQKVFSEKGYLELENNFLNDKLDGVFSYYYPNGLLKETETYKDGVLSGKNISYHPNGGVHCSIDYAEGEYHGTGTCLYPNGGLKSVITYKNGKVDGNFKKYNEVGDVIYDFNYKENKLEGKCVEYYDGKLLKSEGNYQNGIPVGSILYYSPDGKTESETKYTDGKITESLRNDITGNLREKLLYDEKEMLKSIIYFDKDGKKHYEEKYSGGKLRGGLQYTKDKSEPEEIKLKGEVFTIKSFSGQKIVEGKIAKGKMVGLWKRYHESGNLSSEQFYENDEAHGVKKEYNENGELTAVMHYSEGNLNGRYSWYNNGKLKGLHYYLNGEQTGPFFNIANNGNIIYEGYIVNGQKIRSANVYYREGKLYTTSEYINGEITHLKTFKPDGTSDYELNYKELNGEHVYTQSSGLINVKTNYKNGILDGLTTAIRQDQKLNSSVNFKNGVIHGAAEYYFPNSVKSAELSYYAGLQHGKQKRYDLLGSLRMESHYIMGMENGKTTRFYNSGKPMNVTEYLADEKHGESVYYNMKGKVIAIIGYAFGRMTYYQIMDANENTGPKADIKPNESVTIESKYKNGKPAIKISVKNGLKEGFTEIFGDDGKQQHSSFYKNDALENERKEYYENGKISRQEIFQHGDYNGTSVYFDESGSKILEVEYVDDEYHGEFRIFKQGKPFKTLYYDSDIFYKEVVHPSF